MTILIDMNSASGNTAFRFESVQQNIPDLPVTDADLRDIATALQSVPFVQNAHGEDEIFVSITVPAPDRSVSYP